MPNRSPARARRKSLNSSSSSNNDNNTNNSNYSSSKSYSRSRSNSRSRIIDSSSEHNGCTHSHEKTSRQERAAKRASKREVKESTRGCSEQENTQEPADKHSEISAGKKRFYQLFRFEELPHWMQDNPKLLTGYRVNIGWKESARSACHAHNETVNFWTHALACGGIAITLILTLIFVSPYGMDRLTFDVWQANPVEIWDRLSEKVNVGDDVFKRQAMCPAPGGATTDDIWDSLENADLVERLRHHLPNIARLTSLLKQKADDFTHMASREHFLSYITEVENQIQALHIQDTLEESLERLRNTGLGELVSRAQLDLSEATHHILCSFTDFVTTQMQNGTNVTLPVQPAHIDFQFKLSPSAKSLHSYMAVWPLALFVFTALCCLGFSAMFHLFQAVDQRWAVNLQCLDYAGICLLISGSCVAIVYYGLYCQPFWMWLYITLQTVAGVIGFLITVLLQGHQYRVLKTVTFISLGVLGVVPVTHIYIHLQDAYWFLGYLVTMGAMYLGGAWIYVARVPEVWFPEVFDVIGSSHQIWHVLIVLAVFTLYVGLLNFFEWRIATGCAVP